LEFKNFKKYLPVYKMNEKRKKNMNDGIKILEETSNSDKKENLKEKLREAGKLPKKAGRFERVGSAGIIVCSKVLGVVTEVVEPLVDTTNDIMKREGKELLSNLGKSIVEAAKGINSIGIGIGNIGKGIEKIGTELTKSTNVVVKAMTESTNVVVKAMTENTKLLTSIVEVGIARNYDTLEKGIASFEKGILLGILLLFISLVFGFVYLMTINVSKYIGMIFSIAVFIFVCFIGYNVMIIVGELAKGFNPKKKKFYKKNKEF
jgi:hypothetical protein